MQPITKLGAEKFVAAYVAALNSATESGDLERVSRLDDGSCQSCDATLTAISKIYRSGGRIEGGSWTADVVSQIERNRGWVVDVRLKFSPQAVYDRDGRRDDYKGGEGLASFIVRELDGEWRVDEWTRAD